LQVYAISDVLEANAAIHCPRLEMPSRSKLSCVCWNTYMKHMLLAADYDGCLALWDTDANACTATFEEHAKRVWSADFSQVGTEGLFFWVCCRVLGFEKPMPAAEVKGSVPSACGVHTRCRFVLLSIPGVQMMHLKEACIC
jgi:hypothetical protein